MADLNELRSRLSAVVREFLAEDGLLRGRSEQGESLFSALEDAAVQVGDAVTREVLEQELAACEEPDTQCPSCGTAGLRKGERRRPIQTRRGRVEVAEVECYCRRCRRSFFPQSKALGLEPDYDFSPAVWEKVVYAGAQAASFEQAARDLSQLAELDISDQRVRRGTIRIGNERVEQRDAQTAASLNSRRSVSRFFGSASPARSKL